MLKATGKPKKHGTHGEIFNEDKSSGKQLECETNRFKNSGNSRKKNQLKNEIVRKENNEEAKQ